jgi:cellobiose phosphorylase
MRYLGVKPNQLRFYSTMTAYVLYSLPVVRARLCFLETLQKGQSMLWELGISGDNPIIVLKISDIEHLDAVRHLLLAHAWWRFKGVSVDLVLLNEYGNDYRRPLHDRLHDTIMTSHEREYLNRRGGVYLITAVQANPETLKTLLATARCVLQAGQPLTAQLRPLMSQAALAGAERKKPDNWEEIPLQCVETTLNNGIGGFTKDGTEYVIELGEGKTTPMPWCNILTNGTFGMIAAENGPGYTWNANSRENKLTPWYNDPVSGRNGEALYVRDRETGNFWSISPWPARGRGTYRIRHSQGWTTWEYGGYGLMHESTVFIPCESNLRVQILNVFNPGTHMRDLDVTWFCDFVMGPSRENTAPFIIVRKDAQTGAIWAENGYRDEFMGDRVFMAIPGREATVTANRCEFVGVLGGLENPAGMYREELSGNLGTGMGGCCAIRFQMKIPPGMSRQAVLLLGCAENLDDMRAAIRKYATYEQARDAYKETVRQWVDELSVIKVKTPDAAMDIMVNKWLLYQTRASRIMGRSGFYQAGGAIGFRDQLQDMLALIWTWPEYVRSHILDCAAHQFESGDVQHWWHEPARGVRTHISDDLVFLPFVTADYIEHTGDYGILLEEVRHGGAVYPARAALHALPAGAAPCVQNRPAQPAADRHGRLERRHEQRRRRRARRERVAGLVPLHDAASVRRFPAPDRPGRRGRNA